MSVDPELAKRGKSSTAKNNFYTFRNGLSNLNQKGLNVELKKIELAKRQYENYHSHVQRRLVTRFASKIVRSSSNLEQIFVNTNSMNSSLHSNALLPTYTTTTTTTTMNNSKYLDIKPIRQATSKPNTNESENKLITGRASNTWKVPEPKFVTSSPVPVLRREITIADLNRTSRFESNEFAKQQLKSFKGSFSDTFYKAPSTIDTIVTTNQAISAKPILSKSNSQAQKMKKNVKWDKSVASLDDDEAEVASKFIAKMHNSSKPTMYELTRRYDEFKTKHPDMDVNSILPQLVLSKRSNTDLIKRSSYEELVNLTENCKRKFINMINDNDSGFYNSINEKGEPVCDGYDNFGALLKTNSNCSRKNRISANQRSTQFGFDNPFDGSLLNYPPKSKSMDLSSSLDESNANVNSNKSNDSGFRRRSINIFEPEETKSFNKCKGINNEQVTQEIVNHSSIVSSNQKSNSNTSLNGITTSDLNKTNTKRLKEDEEKDCANTFKAQNIRSLTFKSITTY